MNKSNSLLKTIYANEENLLDLVKAQIAAGADPNECTKYFETPLRVASNNGRFDVVKYLFEAGADPSHLEWTPLFHAVAYGDLNNVMDRIEKGDDLHARDTWERTPVLLAVQAGDVEKVTCLIEAGADITDLGRGDKPAIEYAIQMDDPEMLTFLISKGFDIEAYNSFGYTALMQAAESGAIDCVRCLLHHGADIYQKDRSQFSQKTAIAHAATLEIAQVLANAGDDFNQMEGDVRAKLLGLGHQKSLTISKQDYLAQKYRVYGVSNPQVCDFSFWYDMVRCNAGAWAARSQFGDTDSCNDKPVWSYERYGQSITAIGNGEYIVIAGEHEDFYDPDFCIYNEVFHHRGAGDFTIYQYPKDVFPPTDFHTATLVGDYIYIIGNLGYRGERYYGHTPVYRLNIQTFRMERVDTNGECPGWIYNHSAHLEGGSVIRIQGGEILEGNRDAENHRINQWDFVLDLESLRWSKQAHVPRSGKQLSFPEEYKRFRNAERSLVAIEEDNHWCLLKIVSVHRIDVSEGEEVRFRDEAIKAKSNDYFFAVAYSKSEPFENLDQLQKAANNNRWPIEELCQVCRTVSFPARARFIGFADIHPEEREAFEEWKLLFNKTSTPLA